MRTAIVVSAITIVLSLSLASMAAAQDSEVLPERDIHHLGGTTQFYRAPLAKVGGLKGMAGAPGIVKDIRTILGYAGIPSLTDDVVAALAAANTSVIGGVCSDATPQDGTIVECEVRPGQSLKWMAYRPKGNATLSIFQPARWAGPKPFRAYLFNVTKDNKVYTFVVPKDCGNLSLMNVIDVPRVVVPGPPPAPAPPPPPPPPAPVPLPAPRPMEVTVPPPPPPPAQVATVSSPFFIDALFGKDRRTRPIENTNLEFSQCSPLVGFKLGVAKRFKNDWELAAAAGIAFSLVRADDKVTEHELFIDVEANKYLDNGVFLGTGLSLWDLTHSDTWTPAWMVHAGVPLSKGTRVKTYFLVEGRLFMDGVDDIQNNYQFWGGVRVHF